MRTVVILLLFAQVVLSQNLVLKNVNIIPVNHDITIRDCNVFIRNGVIEKITPFPEIKEPQKKYKKKKESLAGYTVIDCGGKYLIPGLADMHAHFPVKTSPIKTQEYLRLSLAAGVTTLRSMRGERAQLLLRDSVNKGLKKNSPEMFISFMYPEKDSLLTKDSIERYVTLAKQGGYDFIKFLDGSDEQKFMMLSQSCKRNNIPLAGHDFMDDLSITAKAGFASVEHYHSIYTAYKKDSIAFKSLLDTMKVKGMGVCPTLSYMYIKTFQYSTDELLKRNGMQYVSAKVKAEWLKSYNDDLNNIKEQLKENFESKFKEGYGKQLTSFNVILRRLVATGAPLLLSADEAEFNVPGFSMYEEMKLYKAAGLSNYQILKSATLNAAIVLKQQKSWGSIEIGKKANLVLLNGNPLENIENMKGVEATIIQGRYYTQQELLK